MAPFGVTTNQIFLIVFSRVQEAESRGSLREHQFFRLPLGKPQAEVCC